MSAFKTIYWKQAAESNLSAAELYALLMNDSGCGYFAELPIDEIAKALLSNYQGARHPKRVGNSIVWHCGGDIHRVEIERFYFQYGHHEDPDGDGTTQAASFESMDILSIAGQFGCVVYHPNSDLLVSRPWGLAVRSPITLKSSYPTVEPAVQIPAESYYDEGGPSLDYCFAAIMSDTVELEKRTGLILEDGVDSLDYFKVALIRIGNRTCELQQRTQKSQEINVSLPSDTSEPGQFVDTLLAALGLTSEHLSWKNDQVSFVEHELYCRDDNGREVMIEKLPCLANALHKVRQLAERGDKKVYWTEPVAGLFHS